MIRHLGSTVSNIWSANDQLQLRDAVHEGVRLLGFSSFILAHRKQSKNQLVADPTLTNWSDDDIQKYTNEQWFERDPVLAYSVIADQPRAWTLEEWSDSPTCGDYTRYMTDLGMHGGVTAPLASQVGEFGAISAVSHIPEAISGETASAVWVIGQCAALRAETIGLASSGIPGQLDGLALLTDHQLEVLEWIAKGKSNADIALITARSRRVTAYHVAEILRKLHVSTRAQAAALYFALAQN